MKKNHHAVPGVFILLFLLMLSCQKDESAFKVYAPPESPIRFSNVSDLVIDSTGKSVNLKADITSLNGLQKVEIIYAPWSISKTITPPGGQTYTVNESVVIPLNAALQIHSVVIRAVDKNGNSNFTEVKIGLQNLNYNKLYLADVQDNASLTSDLYGVPMIMDKTGAHSYQVLYYARKAGVAIRFLPSKTSFTPVALGKDPSNSSKLITDGSASLPITLGNTGYYRIKVNTLLLTYSVESVSATGNAFSQVAIVGRGFYDFPNMNWQNTLPNLILMDKDPLNPFLFTREVRVGVPAGQTYTTAQFIFTTNNGWSNFWRFDAAGDPELAVFNGGANTDLPITSQPVNYLFIFDSFTGRVQAIRK